MSELGSYDITLRVRRAFRRVPKAIDTFGEQALFYARVGPIHPSRVAALPQGNGPADRGDDAGQQAR